MSNRLTNNAGISLPLAVWLAADEYDFRPQGKAISATSIIKPTRQILLKERLTPETRQQADVSDFIASRLGHSIHDGIEKAWKEHYRAALRTLGYPDNVIDKIRINPKNVEPGTIPVYLEQRGERELRGYKISGKFDMCIDGELQDTKSTSVWSYIKGNKDEDYRLQGSIYRWIHQDKITSDHINIQFVFTDWQRAMTFSNPDYPKQRVHEHRVQLMSLAETEQWLNNKISELEAVATLPQHMLPRCSDKDLWRTDPVYKYYSNPAKTDGRATKNFDSKGEAMAHQAKMGKGIVIDVPGKVKACAYCPAFPICEQKDEYDHA